MVCKVWLFVMSLYGPRHDPRTVHVIIVNNPAHICTLLQYSTEQCSTVQYSIKPYGTVRLFRGQNPFFLQRSKFLISLRTVWEEIRGAQQPESPPKQSSVKLGFCYKGKYKLNSTRPLGQATVQGAYKEPLRGELYVTLILSPVQSQLPCTDCMVFL